MAGIGFGLPDLLHPDEPAYVLQALAIAARLPNGLTFANPPLFKYLLLGEYAENKCQQSDEKERERRRRQLPGRADVVTADHTHWEGMRASPLLLTTPKRWRMITREDAG